jgi:hypothetical protein
VLIDYVGLLAAQDRMRKEFTFSDRPSAPRARSPEAGHGSADWRSGLAALLRRTADRLERAKPAALAGY